MRRYFSDVLDVLTAAASRYTRLACILNADEVIEEYYLLRCMSLFLARLRHARPV
jgi:hypothetical protein